MFKPGYWTVLSILLLVGPREAAARLVRVGNDFQVSNVTREEQREPDVCVDAAGRFVVVWNAPTAGVAGGVFARYFTSDGVPRDSQFRVNSYPDDSPPLTAVACAGNGAVVVVWDQTRADVDSSGILAQRYASTGLPLGAAMQVNTYVTGFQAYPAVASNEDGAFVVVWMSSLQDGDRGGIFGQRFASAGTKIGSEFRVNSFTAGQQDSPAIAMSMDGAFVVVWVSNSYYPDIVGRRFDAAGSALGDEFVVNQYTEEAQVDPRVAIADGGKFLVAWQDDSERDQFGSGIAGRRFADDGSPIGNEFQVPAYTIDDQLQPDVAAARGSFLVAWGGSFDQDGSEYGVFSRFFESTAATDEFQVNTSTASDQQYPAVSANRVGQSVIAWQSGSRESGSSTIFARRFAVAPDCPGDCNDDGSVVIDELVRGVSVTFGRADEKCLVAADLDEDRQISIDELIAAVDSALFGCVR